MFDAKDLRRLFELLSAELGKAGVRGELFVVGGAVMCLAYGARETTRDVDALFRPAGAVRAAAARVATQAGIEADWLNDAVKGYLSDRGGFAPFLDLEHLRVMLEELLRDK